MNEKQLNGRTYLIKVGIETNGSRKFQEICHFHKVFSFCSLFSASIILAYKVLCQVPTVSNLGAEQKIPHRSQI